MSLRGMLGADAISSAHGFGVSPCQRELLVLAIERAVRNVGAPPMNNRTRRRNSDEREESSSSGVVLAFVGIWVVLAVGATGVWLTGEVRVFGLVALATAIVASLLVLYLRLAREAAATDAH